PNWVTSPPLRSGDRYPPACGEGFSVQTGEERIEEQQLATGSSDPVFAVANADAPKLGELLVESQLIASSQLEEALLQQSASGKRLGELLVELGAIDDFDLARVLGTRLELPLADLRQNAPEDDAIALVSESIARAHLAIPVRKTDDGLQVAMAFPQDA